MVKPNSESVREFLERYDAKMQQALGDMPIIYFTRISIKVSPSDWKLLLQDETFRTAANGDYPKLGPNIGGHKVTQGDYLEINAKKFDPNKKIQSY